MSVSIRKAKPEDAPVAGPICYQAFHTINSNHNFPLDIPAPEIATGLLQTLFSHPGFYCIVAEKDGRIVGSNCLDERSAIFGIGPITVDPSVQNAGIGARLMRDVMDRAQSRSAPGIRLVQAAFHNRSLSLYAKLGFDVREPLSCFQGVIGKPMEGFSVRPMQSADIDSCNRICTAVHGHHRGGELADGVRNETAKVVERRGRITGYTTDLAFFGHTVAESNADLQALIAAAPALGGPGILVPTRNAPLFRWCLENGLRVTQPMMLMTMGLYNEPAGAYLPSVLY
jgi:predicted N-acetyltransferase YhbS